MRFISSHAEFTAVDKLDEAKTNLAIFCKFSKIFTVNNIIHKEKEDNHEL